MYGAIPPLSKIADDGVTTNSKGTVLTANATIHTKGAYTTLIASTAFAAKGLLVQIGTTRTAADAFVDIAIGGAGSETVIVPNMMSGSGNGNCTRQPAIYIPLMIPAGTRISARTQSTFTAAAITVKVHLLGTLLGGMEPYGKAIEFGADTSVTQGTTVDPGAVANTKGAWTQLTASCPLPLKALYIDNSNLVQTARSSADWLLDIGIGAAASELVIIPNIWIECVTIEDTIAHFPTPLIPVSVPAGSRISARCQCSLTTATLRNLALGIMGFA